MAKRDNKNISMCLRNKIVKTTWFVFHFFYVDFVQLAQSSNASISRTFLAVTLWFPFVRFALRTGEMAGSFRIQIETWMGLKFLIQKLTTIPTHLQVISPD